MVHGPSEAGQISQYAQAGGHAVDRFTDRVAVITGGASGIGRATARRLASEGATVVIVDLNREAGQELAAELKGCGRDQPARQ